jgi:hypothetical protein
MKITLTENKIGHIIIVNDKGKEYYAQIQNDIEWIESNLNPEEIEELHNGYDIIIDSGEPRFSCFNDLLYIDEQE